MKTKNVFPPDFGEFYEKNFGTGVGYVNQNLLISNFLKISCVEFLTFSECYWGNKMYMIILKFDFMKISQLLKFRGNRKFKKTLMDKFFFDCDLDKFDFSDEPFEEFFDTPIEVMLESVLSNERIYISENSFQLFEATRFSFPRVLNLK